ncbi:PEP-CTERM sorting domain-containing protein [bacterium]|nr:PEP-CTERM sorting domain-containing protein [bacterium]
MIKRWTTFCLALFMSTVICCMTAQAIPIIGNYQSAFRLEGADLVFTPDFAGWDGGVEVPTYFSHPAADFSEFGVFGGGGGTGLGTIVFDIQRAAGVLGSVFGSLHTYFDLEVDETINTFFNEYGDADTLGSGVNPNAVEIDEPGFSFGDIYLNFEDGALDNTNAVPITLFPDGEDVSVALGWENFELLEGQSATLTIVASDMGATAPGSSFTIRHIDPDSPATITFSGALEIKGGASTSPPAGVIPEPSTFILLGFGLLGLLAGRQLKRVLL